ncbi:MAG TPA: hypothetical protein VEZ11_09410 [Thermoanaerobaculia bacterium]|nr:hypothetical protein [Thermoanaerobaculia bacterium]
MTTRRANWLIWAGFVLTPIAFFSYIFFFSRFVVTRDVPWTAFLLFAAAAILLIGGLRRAFARESAYRGRIAGPILAIVSAGIMVLAVFGIYVGSRLPASPGAPRVGQNAPPFVMLDTNKRAVSLSDLLTAPVAGHAPKGVLLVFYRGYW